MGKDGRFERREWDLRNESGNIPWDRVHIAVLMDIRDVLDRIESQNSRLLSIFECRNFLNVPKTLSRIARNTARHRCKTCPATAETMRGLRQHGRMRQHAVE